MGDFIDMYCFANDPYECEFVYDQATVFHTGEFKCQICDIEGERQETGTDDDLEIEGERSIDQSSSSARGTPRTTLSLACRQLWHCGPSSQSAFWWRGRTKNAGRPVKHSPIPQQVRPRHLSHPHQQPHQPRQALLSPSNRR
ncbi:unnamed protein product [Ectocarpus fasciculatus]